MVRESRDLGYGYGGRREIIRQHGDFCDACGEEIFNSDEAERYLAAVNAFSARVDAEPLAPAEVRRIRKNWG